MKKLLPMLSAASLSLFATVPCGAAPKLDNDNLPAKLTIDLSDEVELELIRVDSDDEAVGKTFYIGKYELTQEQYDAIMGEGSAVKLGKAFTKNAIVALALGESIGLELSDNDDQFRYGKMFAYGATHPVWNISWAGANEYCGRLNAKNLSPDKWAFSLPTIAQWKYAAKGGTKSNGTRYCGSDTLAEVGWYRDNAVARGYGKGIHPVGDLEPNELGLYDMSGNIEEVCLNKKEDKAAYCGGAWMLTAADCRKGKVRFDTPDGSCVSGFRIVLVYDGKSNAEKQQARNEAEKKQLEVAVNAASRSYMVIDLSGGRSAESYPVTSLDDIPSGGWTDEYKTTKLVLRRIEAGSFTMGSPGNEENRKENEVQHRVTLSKDYYIGVFEVTQEQWMRVMDSNPSENNGDKRPVDSVSYNLIRGDKEGAKWPSSPAVDMSSFIGRLREKTKLSTLDLPTEAQWEYACRAGAQTAFNTGDTMEGRYSFTKSGFGGFRFVDEKGGYNNNHTTVGTYSPNAWGLYDMHGNVTELCLDGYVENLGAGDVTDPVGVVSEGGFFGKKRVCRGGSWMDDAKECRSAMREDISASGASVYADQHGFRLCCGASPLAEDVKQAWQKKKEAEKKKAEAEEAERKKKAEAEKADEAERKNAEKRRIVAEFAKQHPELLTKLYKDIKNDDALLAKAGIGTFVYSYARSSAFLKIKYNEEVASQLNLTEEQKKKIKEIDALSRETPQEEVDAKKAEWFDILTLKQVMFLYEECFLEKKNSEAKEGKKLSDRKATREARRKEMLEKRKKWHRKYQAENPKHFLRANIFVFKTDAQLQEQLALTSEQQQKMAEIFAYYDEWVKAAPKEQKESFMKYSQKFDESFPLTPEQIKMASEKVLKTLLERN